MQLYLKMLNVGDGDAIILSLQKKDHSIVILIDGGHPNDCDLVIEEMDLILKNLEKKAPDIIVCTHYDNDHIGGLRKVISNYKTDIGRVWIHNTESLFKLGGKYRISKQERESIFPSEDDVYLGSFSSGILETNDPDIQFVLESLKQEIELIELINSYKILMEEPIAGICEIEGWPEITILGPTPEFYKKMFPGHFDEESFLIAESDALKEVEEDTDLIQEDPCILFDKLKKSNVTNPNLNSVIILIEIGEKKFLFTGDAGIASFYAIPDYAKVLSNIHFLKVPHHASKNNISSEIIKLMSPKYSFVSGNKHVSAALVNCLKKNNSNTKITRDEGNLEFII